MNVKAGGISIPSSYTAHLAPLSSSKLFGEVRAGPKHDKVTETPYVVMFQAVNLLSGDGGGPRSRCGTKVQECWEFKHPRRDAVLDARGPPSYPRLDLRLLTCFRFTANQQPQRTLGTLKLSYSARRNLAWFGWVF